MLLVPMVLPMSIVLMMVVLLLVLLVLMVWAMSLLLIWTKTIRRPLRRLSGGQGATLRRKRLPGGRSVSKFEGASLPPSCEKLVPASCLVFRPHVAAILPAASTVVLMCRQELRPADEPLSLFLAANLGR